MLVFSFIYPKLIYKLSFLFQIITIEFFMFLSSVQNMIFVRNKFKNDMFDFDI